jgi:mycoredoxin
MAGVSQPVTIFSTPWCGYCVRLKHQLDALGVAYTEVDISEDPEAAELVVTVNHGLRTVPTLLFADGSTLTNPSAQQVLERAEACA